MRKGSITIFTTLTMVLVASVLFALLEAARVNEIEYLSNFQTELALESAFANYNTTLWDEYKILACDSIQIQEILLSKGSARVSDSMEGLNLLAAKAIDVEELDYTLLTDGNGAVYVKTAARMMEESIGLGTAKQIFSQYESIRHLIENSEWDWNRVEVEGIEWDSSYEEVNPLKEAKGLQETGILELVVEDTSLLSLQEFDNGNTISSRKLQVGRNPRIPQIDWLDQVLFQQYLLEHMSFYGNVNSEHCLQYELEYVIGGKASDIENLKVVATQLLFIREVANFLYLTTDESKVEEAAALALVLAGASANPIVIDVVKWGILTAWAFGESVLDVRALLQGKKIALLKSSKTWTLGLQDIGRISQGYHTAKECEDGISYKDYLGILLLFQQEAGKVMRAMDAQEATVRLKEENTSFQLDTYLVQTEVTMEYAYQPVFSQLTSFGPTDLWKNSIFTTARYSYQ